MFECKFCGHTSDNPRAKFCAECGPEGPAVRWTDEEVDKLSNIERYVELLGSLPDLSGAAALEEQTKSLREKLKISHPAHQLAIEATFAKVSGSANSDQLAVFYNSNFSEAYAGHDTFIEFRFDNRTEDKFFKARLEWNDVDTDSRIDLKLSVDRYITPGGSRRLGTTVVFNRAGLKELDGLKLELFDESGAENSFHLNPLRVRVNNPSVNIHNSYSQSNSISIEGRGVVDAAGLGSGTHSPQIMQEDSWCALEMSPRLDVAKTAQEIFTLLRSTNAKMRSDTNAALTSLEQIHEAGEPAEQKPEITKTEEPNSIELSSLKLVLQNEPEHSFSKLTLSNEHELDYSKLEVECLISEGDIVHKDTEAIVMVSCDGNSVALTSPVDGVFQFSKATDDAKQSKEWFAAVTLLDIENLIVEAVLIDQEIFIDKTPNGLHFSLSSINERVSSNGKIGSAHCHSFDVISDIILRNGSAISNLELECMVATHQSLHGKAENSCDESKSSTLLARVKQFELVCGISDFFPYFGGEKVELTSIQVSTDRITSSGETLFFLKINHVQYPVTSAFPAKLVNSSLGGPDASVTLAYYGATADSTSLLLCKTPRDGYLFLSLSNCDVEEHYIDIGGAEASNLEFKFKSEVNQSVDEEEIVLELQTDKVNIELEAGSRGNISYIRPSSLPATATLLYELISSSAPHLRHRYHYHISHDSALNTAELQSKGDLDREVVAEYEEHLPHLPSQAVIKKKSKIGLSLLAVLIICISFFAWIGPSNNSSKREISNDVLSDESQSQREEVVEIYERGGNIHYLPDDIKRQAERMFGSDVAMSSQIQGNIRYEVFTTGTELTTNQFMELYVYYEKAKDFGAAAIIAFEMAKRLEAFEGWDHLGWLIENQKVGTQMTSQERLKLSVFSQLQSIAIRESQGVSTTYPRSQIVEMGAGDLAAVLAKNHNKDWFFQQLKPYIYF